MWPFSMRILPVQLRALTPELSAYALSALLFQSRAVLAFAQTPVSPADLDLSSLGRVALAGDFDSISIYSYVGQTESTITSNGSQALWTQYPNGAFQNLGTSDASINALCSFIANGKLAGVVLGGNFTSIAGVEAQSAALWNPSNGVFSNLDGLDGSVNALYCDAADSTVYFGGFFSAPNAMNAMAWVTNWTALPFTGFNGPVNAITKNSRGNLVFAGQFDGLGNTSQSVSDIAPMNSQVIPLASGDITAVGTATTHGFDEPRNIVCQTGKDGSGNAWLLQDGIRGYWQGVYDFGYNPTKLRLYNTKYQGRGTKTFYFENLNSGGVPNLVYTDASGKNQSCSSVCPLPEATGPDSYRDFYFVPSVGMSQFRIWITGWYGAGGGLAGIEMFQDDLYSFAVNEFNEPKCDSVSNASSSTNTPAGTWFRVANNGTSSSDWLSAYLTEDSQLGTGTNVVFQPNVPVSGNYSILMYTPGCTASNTCSTRGIVNVTVSMTSKDAPISTTVTQTNDYDKFDQIYYGPVDGSSSSFKPEVTLSPMPGQTLPLTVVAQRVRFDIVTTTGGLNGLYEYDPSVSAVSGKFQQSPVDAAGSKLRAGAEINALETSGNVLYAGGNFKGSGINNIMQVDKTATSLSNGGLNDAVFDLYLDSSALYVAGNFTSTADASVKGLNNVAMYDTANNKWNTLGGGLSGPANKFVNLSINISPGKPERVIAITGTFSAINAYGHNKAVEVNGFAVWVPGMNNWLNNIPSATVTLQGDLLATANVPGYQPVFAGDVSSQVLGLSDVVGLAGSGTSQLQSLGIKINPTTRHAGQQSVRRRTPDPVRDYAGVYTGLFYDQNGLNITVLGGQFSATASDGSTVQNLVFVNDTNAQSITGLSGLDSDSTIIALANYGTTLYAGGSLTGKINGNPVTGLVAYDLSTGAAVIPQPPSLSGNNVVVNTIALQPDTSMVYFGGHFSTAGSLPCPTLCYYDATLKQWNTPGDGLSGTVSTMFWSSKTTLIVAGDLKVNGHKAAMATYDSKHQTFTEFTGSSGLPGPITALDAADSAYDTFWASGVATNNGSTYLSRYSDNTWTAISGLGDSTTIRGLQVMSLTRSHSSSTLLSSNMALMLVGNIAIPNFGNASAALFNGTNFTPFLLTNKDDGSQGTISSIFVSNPQELLNSNTHQLALGLVVLIGLAIALGLICILIAVGILIERHRRRNQGYVPMPAISTNGAFSRVPPETLFGHIAEKGAPPRV